MLVWRWLSRQMVFRNESFEVSCRNAGDVTDPAAGPRRFVKESQALDVRVGIQPPSTRRASWGNHVAVSLFPRPEHMRTQPSSSGGYLNRVPFFVDGVGGVHGWTTIPARLGDVKVFHAFVRHASIRAGLGCRAAREIVIVP